MSENQISQMMGNLVANQRFFSDLDKSKRQWILENPKDAIALLSIATIRKDEIKYFPIWRTIEIGTGLKIADDFCRAIKDQGNCFCDFSRKLLSSREFSVAQKRTSIDLVKVTLRDLGFEKGKSEKDVLSRAKVLGLEPVPAEVAPQLRLVYQDQPHGEKICMFMNSLPDYHNNLYIFSLVNDENGLELRVVSKNTNSYYCFDNYWIFTYRKIV